ncbi:MAG: hypothetical protein WAQ25_02250 [Candidatus Saccharimonas sp.]
MNQLPTPQAPITKRSSTRTSLSVAVIVLGAVVILPVLGAVALWLPVAIGSQIRCSEVQRSGPGVVQAKTNIVESAGIDGLQTEGTPQTSAICNENSPEYRSTVAYTATTTSVDDITVIFTGKLNTRLDRRHTDFRQSDDGSTACRQQSFVDVSNQKIRYDVTYLYGDITLQDCVYLKSSTLEGSRAASYTPTNIKFIIEYRYTS